MSSSVVKINNPLCPWEDREIFSKDSGFTISELVAQHPDTAGYPFIVMVNGEAILRREWNLYFIHDKDVVIIFRLLEGGGGREAGSKDPIGVVAGLGLLALGIVTSIVSGGTAVGILAGIGMSGAGVAMVVSGAIPAPGQPSVNKVKKLSPTYDIGGNQARLGEAVPVIYGQHRIYPDLISRPYELFELHEASPTDLYNPYVSNKHFYFCIGAGYYELKEIRVGDTLLDDLVSAGTAFYDFFVPDLEPENSAVLSQLSNLRHYVTCEDVANVSLNLDRDRYPKNKRKSAHIVGAYDYGPLTLLPYTTRAITAVRVNVVIPPARDSFDVYGDDLQFLFAVRDKYNRAIRTTTGWISKRLWVPRGSRIYRYLMYFGSSIFSNLNVDLDTEELVMYIRGYDSVDLRASITSVVCELADYDYRPVRHKFDNLTFLHVNLRSDAVIPSSSQNRINCIVHHPIKYYQMGANNTVVSGDTEAYGLANRNPSPRPNFYRNSENPINIVIDMLTSPYGGNFPLDLNNHETSILDMPSLIDLSNNVLDGYSFNGVFDKKMSMWEAIKSVSRASRGFGIIQNGKFRVIVDEAKNIPTAMFSPNNITKKSFSIHYLVSTQATKDSVQIEYMDYLHWKNDIVVANENGKLGRDMGNSAKIEFFGCIYRDMAQKEALYLARNNVYRRKKIVFTTEMEGFSVTLGDLIYISHDMPKWGMSGEVERVKPNGTIVLNESIQFSPNGVNQISFRNTDGSVFENGNSSIFFDAKEGFGNREVRLDVEDIEIDNSEARIKISEDNFITLYFGGNKQRTYFVFNNSEQYGQLATIESIKPRGEFEVEITAINYDSRIFEGA